MLTRLRHSRPVGLVRYHAYRDVLLAWPRRHRCNICHWRGRRFLTYCHRFVLCPQCGSSVRHRLIAAALALPERVAGTSGVSHLRGAVAGRVLHVSPEYCLGLVLRPRARRYLRADYIAADCDVRQDITRMPFAAATFDAVVCSDTLEHIVDDRAALAECRRVLTRGGIAILTVPQRDDDGPTIEDATVTTDAERSARFGQADHVRVYGSDFGDRIAAAGFRVTAVDASTFDPAYVAEHVLTPPVPIDVPWGGNLRRVYFAEAA